MSKEMFDATVIIGSKNNLGFIKTIAEDGICKVSYLYDEIGQLIREDNNWINQTVTYHYDVGGNLLERNEYAYTTGLLGAILHQTGYQYEDTNWKDKLTKYKGQNMTYDAIGNPLTYRDNIQMTWENGRELSTLSQGGLSMSFQYDCGGIRTRKIVDGVETRYYLKGSQIQTQITGEERLDFLYDEQEQLLGIQTGEETFYYVRNMQQDIIGILDREGTQVVFYTYDSWGKLVAVTGSKKDSIGQKNPFRYRGYYYDVETGLFYVGSRYYDPSIGRFINADDIDVLDIDQNSLMENNLFAYCLNNPVNKIDSDGKFAVALADGIAVALVDGIAAAGGANFWNPVGWIIGGAIAIGLAAYAVYKIGTAISDYRYEKSKAKQRSKEPIARRKNLKSKKKAYDKAKKVGKGKEPRHDPNGHEGDPRPHYHPNVSTPKSITPKAPSPHDHYYYSKR